MTPIFRVRRTLSLSLLLVVVAGPALADCRYNGSTYAEGTRIGSLVCTNGSWKPG